jgi:hypothetical protein
MRFWQNLIWAHFRLRRKPGFAGVPPLRGRSAPLQSLAQSQCPPLAATDCIQVPQGVGMIPMIDTFIIDFELMFSG